LISFVVDASIALAWVFDEVHPKASLGRESLRTGEAIVPSLWWFEVRNGLIMGERRGRLSERDTPRFLRDISRLALRLDRLPYEAGVLTLARRHRLTVYDAAYLELAQRMGVALATLDTQLAEAARAEQVPLFGEGTKDDGIA
jgi:predicted nucleic acid-binding protein